MLERKYPEIFRELPVVGVERGTVLVRPGQKSNYAYYVVSGCLRSYIVDSKGKEHIYQFAPEDWIVSDLELYRNNGLAVLTIDAIENSEVKLINTSALFQISYGEPKLIEDVLAKFQNRIYALQNRVLQLLSHTAEERYLQFLKTYPDLHNRVPLKMIASYLGLTPESLSRVRKEMTKGR
jgi:CRP-like cAMP-binding protein